MATINKDHLSDLDRHVQILEGKINQHRASLTHFQKWYLEYSALKEDVDSLPKDPPPRKELARIRRDFDGDLLTTKEINEIFGKNDLKELSQISSAINRRLDYVEQNIGSLQKLIEEEENKLAAASVIINPDGGTDEETGLPITDIIEELDEDDNVIQSRLQSGGDAGAKIVEALKKAGIEEIPESAEDLKKLKEKASTSQQPEEEKASAQEAPAAPTLTSTPSASSTNVSDTSSKKSSVSKKSVSFAEDTKPAAVPVARANPPPILTAKTVEELMRLAKEQEEIDLSNAVIPTDESPEDAQLRRDMLNYSMSEIGPVVAELEVDEDEDVDDASWDDEYDEDEDDEDDLGRSKHSVITEDYVKRMQELEKRLGFKSAFTAQPDSRKPDPRMPDAGIGRITISGTENKLEEDIQVPKSALKKEPNETKKEVKFAAALDIADENVPQPPPKPKASALKVDPVGDIVEKKPISDVKEVQAPQPPTKRVSKFKKERAAAPVADPTLPPGVPPGPQQLAMRLRPEPRPEPPAEPTPPEDKLVADAVVERPVTSQPLAPDDMDSDLLYRAATVEYNKMRNRIIQQQGGFVKEEEKPVVSVEEELQPKMSRFKAARLARS